MLSDAKTAWSICLRSYNRCMELIKLWVKNDPNPSVQSEDFRIRLAQNQFNIVIQSCLLQASISNGTISDNEIDFFDEMTKSGFSVLDYMRSIGKNYSWEQLSKVSDCEAVEICNIIYDAAEGVANAFARKYAPIAKGRGNETKEFLESVDSVLLFFYMCDDFDSEMLGTKAVKSMFADLWNGIKPITAKKPSSVSGGASSSKYSIDDILDILVRRAAESSSSESSSKSTSAPQCLINKNNGFLLNYAKHKSEYTKTVIYLQVTSSQGLSSGTGFVISDDGYAVTNAHVVKGALKITAKLTYNPNSPIFSTATVVKVDDDNDVAIIKLNYKNLQFCEIDDSCEYPVIGDDVVMLGYPSGESLSDSAALLNVSFSRGYIKSNQI